MPTDTIRTSDYGREAFEVVGKDREAVVYAFCLNLLGRHIRSGLVVCNLCGQVSVMSVTAFRSLTSGSVCSLTFTECLVTMMSSQLLPSPFAVPQLYLQFLLLQRITLKPR